MTIASFGKAWMQKTSNEKDRHSFVSGEEWDSLAFSSDDDAVK